MNNEKKMEIIKSLAYGMAAEEIAACEDVTAAEVEQISRDCADEVAQKKAWLERRHTE